jgi:protein TonB
MDRPQRFMVTAALISALGHAIPIMGLRFVAPTPKRNPAAESLEVVLVNQKTQSAPSRADVLAQVNSDGGGNTDAKLRAQSPLPADADPVLQQTVEQQKQLEERQEQLMAQLRSDSPLHRVDRSKSNAGKSLNPEQLLQQARELAGVAGQIGKDYQAYQEKPRKAFVGARAKQTSVAMWLDAWMQKIERIGTYAYPVDARGSKLRGQLRVTAEVNFDGRLLNSYIDRSSGNPELDKAALRILRMAANEEGRFPVLPADMVDASGKPATVLVITRTWIFGRSDTLGLN